MTRVSHGRYRRDSESGIEKEGRCLVNRRAEILKMWRWQEEGGKEDHPTDSQRERRGTGI